MGRDETSLSSASVADSILPPSISSQGHKDSQTQHRLQDEHVRREQIWRQQPLSGPAQERGRRFRRHNNVERPLAVCGGHAGVLVRVRVVQVLRAVRPGRHPVVRNHSHRRHAARSRQVQAPGELGEVQEHHHWLQDHLCRGRPQGNGPRMGPDGHRLFRTGLCKFGFYEVFKNIYSGILGEENSYLYRTSLYLAASASAEFFADIALSPMESVKVRMQTSPIGTFPTTLREAAPKIYAAEGLNGFYKSLVPLWGRQIPYTMMKFACFERTVEALYQYVVPKPRAECSK